MRGTAALLARSIRWRRWASLVLVLCAAISVAGAAAGPMWGRAAQASLLERTLRDAPVGDLAWTVRSSTDSYGALVYPPPDPRTVRTDVRAAAPLTPDLDQRFDPAGEEIRTGQRLQVLPIAAGAGEATPDPDVKAPLGVLLSREGACGQVEVVSGSCPAGPRDIMLSDRSAEELGATVGQLVQFPELFAERPPPGVEGPGIYRVTGLYRGDAVPTASRFWFDSEDFDFTPPGTVAGEVLPARLDAVLVPADLILSIRSVAVEVQRERVLKPGAVAVTDASRVTRELDAAAVELAATSQVVTGSATAATTLAATGPGRRLIADTATFVGLQVVGFGWVVVLGLVAVGVAAREPEFALAKLRGLRGPRLAGFALAEPIGLVLVAVPFGLVAAWVAVTALARRVLLPGTAVEVPATVWGLVAATVAGSVLACALAARNSLRIPVAEQLRRGPARTGMAGPVATAVLLTLTAVGLVLVLTLGRDAQGAVPALLTPLVSGLAAGALVGRGVQLLLRWSLPRTRKWPLGPYLAIRQLARQSALTQVTALVTVLTTVGGFAAGAYVVSARQREAQARIDVGAQRVVHVAPADTETLLEATRQADPDGAWAMAAIQRDTPGNTLLAVDSSRFAVAYGVPGGQLSGPLPELVPDRIPEPLTVRGTAVGVELGPVFLYSVRVKEFGLRLRYLNPDGEPRSALLGPIDPSAGQQTLRAKVPCAEGCTIAGVAVVRRTGLGDISGSVELAAIRVGGETYPFQLDQWRPSGLDETVPDSAISATLEESPDGRVGVEVGFDANSSVDPGITRLDVPQELPAVVGDRTRLSLVGARQLVNGTTLDGGEMPYSVAGRTPVLPRADAGTVVDLDLVSRVEAPRGGAVDYQVWLGPAAPPDAPQRLAAAGLRPVEVETTAGRKAELDRAEPARAQLLMLGSGAAVLLAGVAGIATVLAAAARRRAVESAALHAMAVPARTVRGSAVLEDGVLLVPGVVAGSGCAAALVVLLTPVLAQVTGASDVVSGTPAALDVALPVAAAAVVTTLLLIPVVLAVTRPAAAETPLRMPS